MSNGSRTPLLIATVACLLVGLPAGIAGASSAPAWYVTFHGGSKSSEINDVVAFDDGGSSLGGVLEKDAAGEPSLRELRGVTFGPDGNLWVVNSYQKDSRVLRFGVEPGSDGKLPFLGTFLEFDSQTDAGLDHPFDIAFDAAGNVYVSSQDTALVTRYYAVDSTIGTPGAPMPLPSGIRPANPGTPYPPGTFVPSTMYTGAAPGVLTSVRGIAFGNDGTLFVADESANQVDTYDGATGAFVTGILKTNSVQLATLGGGGGVLATQRKKSSSGGPIHLLVEPDGTHLLIGTSSNDSVLRYHFSSGKVDTFVSSGSGGLDGPAGMAFASDGDLFVASRKNERILRYDGSSGKPKKSAFVKHLADEPEFVLPLGGQGN